MVAILCEALADEIAGTADGAADGDETDAIDDPDAGDCWADGDAFAIDCGEGAAAGEALATGDCAGETFAAEVGAAAGLA